MPAHDVHPASHGQPQSRHGSRRSGEAGFTLVELLVSMSMFAVVLMAIMALWDTASNAGYNESERNTALSEDTSGLDRMVNDLRQAYHVNGPSEGQRSDWMDILERMPVGTGAQGDYRVIYDCSKTDPTNSALHACYRYVSAWTNPGGTAASPGVPPANATATLVIPRLTNGTSCSGTSTTDCIFTNLTNSTGSTSLPPTTATITIRTNSRGERQPFKSSNYNHDVVLGETVYMRQLDFGH